MSTKDLIYTVGSIFLITILFAFASERMDKNQAHELNLIRAKKCKEVQKWE